MHCSNCKLTLNLPRDAEYSSSVSDGLSYDKKYCPIDGFEVIHYYINRDGFETKLMVCPQCYHRSPFSENGNRMICSQCPNQKCTFSSVNTAVAKCSACKVYQLIFHRYNRTFGTE